MERTRMRSSLIGSRRRRTLLALLLAGAAAEVDAECDSSGAPRGTDPAAMQRAEETLEANGIAVGTDYE